MIHTAFCLVYILFPVWKCMSNWDEYFIDILKNFEMDLKYYKFSLVKIGIQLSILLLLVN